jgi:hypothetical protein
MDPDLQAIIEAPAPLLASDEVSRNGSRTVRAADVQPISIDWLWTDYVPRGFGGVRRDTGPTSRR